MSAPEPHAGEQSGVGAPLGPRRLADAGRLLADGSIGRDGNTRADHCSSARFRRDRDAALDALDAVADFQQPAAGAPSGIEPVPVVSDGQVDLAGSGIAGPAT